MQYRTDLKSGNKLSIIGFGCMRFPKNRTQIDINRTEQLILKAVQEGINYFDTAYVYGGSEETLGPILAKNNLRDKIFLATKLPHVKCKTYNDFESFFQTQLKRLQTDHIDYYLIHNLGDTHLWKMLCELGIEKWIKEKKESDQIKNIGFSFHGIHNEFLNLLDIYDWDFCQMQYNYINTNYQAGTAGLKRAAEKGLPVIIMEPLLGGKLATGLPKKAVNLFKEANSSLTPAAWALRWLWNQKEVTVVLSGMNDMSQIEDNIETAKNAVPNMLTPEEERTIDSVIKVISASYKVPCTGCNYCMPCPHNVNIPACFAAYNVSYTVGLFSGMQQYVTSARLLDPQKKYAASNCKECGSCEKKCPQNIPIIRSLKNVRKRMEPFWLNAALNFYFKFIG
ncbi:MAG: aldo/keto reductase [Candidatus Azobacteroides sp.]|nr:aldo/keto reductase [Candidatus Azobacteroides sp.]